MRQKIKQIFQPLEIALRNALGIKKVKKGKLFDENGFLQDGCEKLIRYALFVPFYQKVKIITNVNEMSDKIARGGGGNSLYLKNAV